VINWPELVERRIREAQDNGLFDQLPGKGKPLDLTRNPFVKPGWESAYRVLEANGFTLDWIELDKAIRTELEECRRFLEGQLHWVESKLGSLEDSQTTDRELQDAYESTVHRYRQSAEASNERMALLNLTIPPVNLHKIEGSYRRGTRRVQRVVVVKGRDLSKTAWRQCVTVILTTRDRR